jgi:dTDP-4-amino-4,6-dideoxygalactose transaminase
MLPRLLIRLRQGTAGIYQHVSKTIRARLNPPIPFIKPFWSDEEIKLGLLQTTIDSQQATDKFINQFREALSLTRDALIVPTGSGRIALELALKTLKTKFPDKDKVLISTYGCRGIFDPLLRSGLTPIYVDIDSNLLVDNERLKENLSSDVLACLLVHLCGKMANTTPILEEARKRGIAVIEDHCQATGAELLYPYTNAKPDFCTYSFGMGKNAMATAGGALVAYTLHEELRTESKTLQPEDVSFAHQRFVFCHQSYFLSKPSGGPEVKQVFEARYNPYDNYIAMNPLDALILVEQLKKLRSIIENRQRNASVIISRLNLFPSIFSTQSPGLHIYTKLSVILKNSALLNDFVSFMDMNAIQSERMYTPLHLRDFGIPFRKEALEVSETIYPLVVNVPVRPNLTKNELARVANAIEEFGVRTK